jgi:hypothetical protein
MADKLSLHIITLRQLGSETCYDAFDDPDGIARPTAAKRRTLLANPVAGDVNEPVQIIGTSGNRVVGRMDLLAGSLGVHGSPTRIFWGSHLFVPPEFRKLLMGVMLVMKAPSLSPAAGAFGPSQAALPLYQKLKWMDLPLPRYIMLIRSGPVVRRYVRGKIWGNVLSLFADAALAAHRTLIAAWRGLRTRSLRVERVEKVPADFDSRFASRTEPVQTHRSVPFLQWQIDNQFTDDARNKNALYVVRRSDGEVAAYFLTKIRFHETATHRGFKNLLLGSMQDWMIFDPAAVDLRDLLLLSSKILADNGVHAIDFCTADTSLIGVLRVMGFQRLGAMHLVVKAGATSPLADPALHDLSKWWIRPGDGDNFFT